MGDRAVLTTEGTKSGIYVHWTGSPEYIIAYAEAAKALKFRDTTDDPTYAMARLCGIICFDNGITGSTSVGIGDLDELDCDNGDNGVYVLGKDWQIVDWYGSGAGELPFDEGTLAAGKKRAEALVERLEKAEKVP